MQDNQTNLRHAETSVEAELSRLSAKIFSITGKDPKQCTIDERYLQTSGRFNRH